MKTGVAGLARDAAARPRRFHPRPAPQRAALAAQAERAGRHLEPVPQPDRARPAQAVGRDPPGDRPRAAHLGRDALRPGRHPRRARATPPDLVAAVVERSVAHRAPEAGPARDLPVVPGRGRPSSDAEPAESGAGRPVRPLGSLRPMSGTGSVVRRRPARRGVQHAHLAARAAGRRRRRRHERVRAGARVRARPRRCRVRRLHPRRGPRPAAGRRGRAGIPRRARRGRARRRRCRARAARARRPVHRRDDARACSTRRAGRRPARQLLVVGRGRAPAEAPRSTFRWSRRSTRWRA